MKKINANLINKYRNIYKTHINKINNLAIKYQNKELSNYIEVMDDAFECHKQALMDEFNKRIDLMAGKISDNLFNATNWNCFMDIEISNHFVKILEDELVTNEIELDINKDSVQLIKDLLTAIATSQCDERMRKAILDFKL